MIPFALSIAHRHNTKYGESRSKGQFLCTHAIAVDYYLNAERIFNELIAEKIVKKEDSRRNPSPPCRITNGNSIASWFAMPIFGFVDWRSVC